MSPGLTSNHVYVLFVFLAVQVSDNDVFISFGEDL